ncbi:MAG: hypothetical protein IPM98_14025 [Lewinellaceae bacterium]|nr:hypothetical protein [Lewinellaceae bacterium]
MRRNFKPFIPHRYSRRGDRREREALLIYKGVRQAVPFPDNRVLVMDIGGGGVEMVLADPAGPIWQQVFRWAWRSYSSVFTKATPLLPKRSLRSRHFWMKPWPNCGSNWSVSPPPPSWVLPARSTSLTCSCSIPLPPPVRLDTRSRFPSRCTQKLSAVPSSNAEAWQGTDPRASRDDRGGYDPDPAHFAARCHAGNLHVGVLDEGGDAGGSYRRPP